MRIMTSNIWGEYFKNPAAEREGKLLSIYNEYAPHILGMQEATDGWYAGETFRALSENYGFVSTEAYGPHNFVPLAFLQSEYRLLAKGYEPVKPERDKTKGISWAVLEEKDTGKAFGVCNAHFWWRVGEEHDVIRVDNALQLCSLMDSLSKRFCCPVFCFGDLNSTLSSPVFRTFAEKGVYHLRDMAEEASTVSSHHGDPVRDEKGVYRGKRTDADYTHSLDHILVMGKERVTVSLYKVVEDQEALDATDHSPVFADIEIL